MNQMPFIKRFRLLGGAVLAAILLHGAFAQEVISFPKKTFGAGKLCAVAFSADGRFIVTGSAAGTLLWDATTGAPIRHFGGALVAQAAAFSPDGTRVAVGYGLTTLDSAQDLHVFDVATGNQTWETKVQSVRQLTFSEDGQTILTRSSDNSGDFVALWDAATGQLQHTNSGTYEILDATISPDGSKVAMACGDERTVRIWDAATGQELRTLWGHTSAVGRVAFSADGSKVLSASTDLNIRVWDAASGALLKNLQNDYWGGAPYQTPSVAFSPDGNKVLMGARYVSADSVDVRLLNIQTGQVEQEWEYLFGFPEKISLSVSRDWTKALVAVVWDIDSDADWAVELLDLVNGGTLSSVPTQYPKLASLSPAGDRMVIDEYRAFQGEFDPVATYLWDTVTGEKLRDLGYHGTIRTIALSSDGETLATGDEAGGIVIWNVNSGDAVRRLDWPDHFLQCLDFSPDGSQLLVTGLPGFMNTSARYGASLWNIATGEMICQLGGPYDQIQTGQFSPGGQQVLLGGQNTQDYSPLLTLWDTATGTIVRSFTGHSRAVLEAFFSPDGNRVVSMANRSGNILMWYTATGALVRAFERPAEEEFYSVCFSPDGTQVLALFGRRSSPVEPEAVLWNADTGQQVTNFPLLCRAVVGRFSPDGRWIVTRIGLGGTDPCYIWDKVTAQRLYAIPVFTRVNWGEYCTVTFSPDGRNLFITDNGVVGMWELFSAPELTIVREADGRVVLTWPNPSETTAYILQQCPDLTSGQWTDLTVSTPGRYEITNPVGSMFYRLQAP